MEKMQRERERTMSMRYEKNLEEIEGIKTHALLYLYIGGAFTVCGCLSCGERSCLCAAAAGV